MGGIDEDAAIGGSRRGDDESIHLRPPGDAACMTLRSSLVNNSRLENRRHTRAGRGSLTATWERVPNFDARSQPFTAVTIRVTVRCRLSQERAGLGIDQLAEDGRESVLMAEPCSPVTTRMGYGPDDRRAAVSQATMSVKPASETSTTAGEVYRPVAGGSGQGQESRGTAKVGPLAVTPDQPSASARRPFRWDRPGQGNRVHRRPRHRFPPIPARPRECAT